MIYLPIFQETPAGGVVGGGRGSATLPDLECLKRYDRPIGLRRIRLAR